MELKIRMKWIMTGLPRLPDIISSLLINKVRNKDTPVIKNIFSDPVRMQINQQEVEIVRSHHHQPDLPIHLIIGLSLCSSLTSRIPGILSKVISLPGVGTILM